MVASLRQGWKRALQLLTFRHCRRPREARSPKWLGGHECEFLIEQVAYCCLDAHRCCPRIRGIPDRTPHYNVVCPAEKGIPRGYSSLLVIGSIGNRSDARSHDEKLVTVQLSETGRFETGRNHSIAPYLERPPCTGYNQILN